MGSEPGHLIWTQRAMAKCHVGHFVVDRGVVLPGHFPKRGCPRQIRHLGASFEGGRQSHRRRKTIAKGIDFNSKWHKASRAKGSSPSGAIGSLLTPLRASNPQRKRRVHSQSPQFPPLHGWVEMPPHLVPPPGAPGSPEEPGSSCSHQPRGAAGLSPWVTPSPGTRAPQGLVWPQRLLENEISVLLAAFQFQHFFFLP